MPRIFCPFIAFIWFVAALLFAPVAATATGIANYSIVHQFGQSKSGITVASDGNYYGTTAYGGTSGEGAIFKVTPTGSYTNIHNFGGVDGSFPYAGLIQASDGFLYGTTTQGGTFGDGTIFRIGLDSTFTTLYSFGGTDGSNPCSSLVQATDSKFYGTTSAGGSDNLGTVFSIDSVGTLVILHSFTGQPDGATPVSGVTQASDGNLYGTTFAGGTSNNGIIFMLPLEGSLSTLHSFSGVDGSQPNASLVEASNGSLYGTTETGGSASGTIFSVTFSGTFTSLYSFGASSSLHNPASGLIADGSGNLYGSVPTSYGNAVYSITQAGNFNIIYYPHVKDFYSQSPLAITGNGNLIGTTWAGGESGSGGIFEVTLSGLFSQLADFPESCIVYPTLDFTQGNDSAFYGIALGGSNATSCVYRLQPFGSTTVIHSFTDNEGLNSNGQLIKNSAGNFYGMFENGSTNGFGSIFEMAPNGSMTSLYSFLPRDSGYKYPLALGSDGNLYGSESSDSAYPFGCIFKLTPTGNFSIFGSFDGNDGDSAQTVIEGYDRNIYGLASGGEMGTGAYFKVSPAGAITLLYSFSAQNYYGQFGNMIQGTDGNFYCMWIGASLLGPTYDYLSYFLKLSPTGNVQFLHEFDGLTPSSTLILASDGNFYGTTPYYLFQLTPSGQLTSVYNYAFDLANGYGYHVNDYLIQARDGKLYGVSNLNYYSIYLPTNEGLIYSIDLGLPPLAPSYNAGLQLISSPFDYTGESLDTLFGYTGAKLAVWSAATGGYAITPTAPADGIHPGVGYWARFPAAETFANVGQMADTSVPFTINLAQGWNMIGDPFLLSVPLSATTYGTGAVSYSTASTGTNPLIRAGVYGYSSSSNAYILGSTLQPFAGYWIYANTATTMNVPYP